MLSLSRFCHQLVRKPLTWGVTAVGLMALSTPMGFAAGSDADAVMLAGHIPSIVSQSRTVGRLDASRVLNLALTLPLRNQDELTDLLHRLSDKHDPLYGHYLTPDEFADRFSPTPEDYDRAIAYAQSMGLTVVGTHPNRTVLDVVATEDQVERVFGVHLLTYQSVRDGRYFFAPDREPLVAGQMASVISGVVGLDNAAHWHSQIHRRPEPVSDPSGPTANAAPLTTGSGPSGGQTLGLFELAGYTASDITGYTSHFGLPAITLQNVLVDGYSGAPGSGADEVTLDIELQAALAPGASNILVYEGPNSNAGVVDTYNKIATDNLAKEISTSWGEDEVDTGASTRNSESTAFQQMAAQGQSIFAAAGDSGADDNGSSLSVDDPASQPYMVGVGGTSLTTNGAGGTRKSETTWNGGSVNAGAGGGGISTVWSIPSYQSGVVSGASKGSTTMRNVPDISLDADPNNGYAIYYKSQWVVYGGTSCAAPLWSAFTALVNQNRVTGGSSLLGFANPPIYAAAQSSYAADFFDIADGSTNLFYPAVAGYDDATGWGTFNGANLLATLSGGTTAPTAPAAPTGLKAAAGAAQVALTWTGSTGATSYNLYRSTTSGSETLYKTGLTTTSYTDTGLTNGVTYFYKVTAVNSVGESGKSTEASATPQAGGTLTQLLGNPGFENGTSAAPWTPSAGVINNSTSEPTHSGSWNAWLDGYGRAHTDTLLQSVAIPSTITSATLSFWLHIDTAETTKTTAYDTLNVQVRNSSGTVLATLGTYSNLNAAAGYKQVSFNLAAYKGQTVQIYLVGKEDSSLQTSFVVDDFALNVQ